MTDELIIISPAEDTAVAILRGNMTEQEYNDEVLGIEPHLDAPGINDLPNDGKPLEEKPF